MCRYDVKDVKLCWISKKNNKINKKNEERSKYAKRNEHNKINAHTVFWITIVEFSNGIEKYLNLNYK